MNKDKIKLSEDGLKKTRVEIYTLINDPKANSTKEGRGFVALYRSFLCGMTGEACTNNPTDGDKNFDKSVLGYTANLIALPYGNPPASGIYWAFSGLENAGFIPRTQAAEGVGFAAVNAFQPLWKIFRNLAYVFLVIVLVVIGFMIMFRVKLNPQTVISVENSLPRIVISLLMITFSFAIAGFLIDLMYFTMALIVSQLSTVNVGDFTAAKRVDLINRYTGAGFWDIYPNIGAGFSFFGLGKSFLGILPDFVQIPIRGTFSIIGALLIVKLFGSETWGKLFDAFSNVGAGGGGSILGFGAQATLFLGTLPKFPAFLIGLIFMVTFFPYIGPFLLSLVMLFTLIFLLFRVFFMLLKTYINIVLLIIFAPVILLLGAVPGRNMFWVWFKNLSINLLIFPFVLTLILIGSIIVKVNTDSGTVWQPPFISGLDPEAFSAIIGIGLILIIPQLVKAFKEAVGLKGLGVQFGVGTFFGGVSGVAGGATTGLSRYGSLSLGLSALQRSPAISGALSKIPGVNKLFPGNTGR